MKNLYSDNQGIPTEPENLFNYDYGEKLNAKLRALGWTPAQYDRYLDYLHQERPIDSLVADLLFFAPPEALQDEADALGIFEEDAA